MQYTDKFSELLGILNSINYDEIINELEVKALKEWVKNNSYSSEEILGEILKKIQKILSDNIISEEEKNEILELIDKYRKKNISIDGMSELVGIIEGIVADNIIHIKEVEKLNAWLDKNTYLAGTFLYDKLVPVSDILKDGILNDVEKQQLKILLTYLLNINKVNQKIDVLKRKIINKENIGNDLISLIGNNAIINKIHSDAIEELKRLMKRNCSVYSVDSEIIFASLTLIALLNYDGNYYGHVEETYKELYQDYNDQKIEGQIRNVINKYRDIEDGDHRIISLVLKNAIVPKNFLPSFFEFIFDIYRLNFEYSVDPNADLNEEFSFVYDGIKKGLNFDDDVLDLKVTNKTYNLIKSTKDLIISSIGINALIKLSISILKIIDNYYWSNPNLSFENEYYRFGFDEWKSKNSKVIQEGKSKTIEFRSRWEPSFKLVEGKILLEIPNHKIKDYYNYEDLKITIYNNDEIIYENTKPDVYDIIGGYRIENKDVLIPNPLGDIRYVLSCKDDVIYDSCEKLYRDFIFFNSIGNELTNNKDYQGLAILCSKDEIEGLNIMTKTDKYILSYKSVLVGDYIKVNNNIFNFASIQKPGLVGRDKDAVLLNNDKEKAIYSEIEGVVYESEQDLKNIALVINNNRIRISDLEVEKKKRGIYNNYFIKFPIQNDEYTLIIEEFENGKYVTKKTFDFVVDKNFSYKIEAYENNEYKVSINYLGREYNKVTNASVQDINKIEFKEHNISFLIKFSTPLYKLDNSKWDRLKNLSNYLWINDITTHSNLRVVGIEFDIVKVVDKEGNVLSTISASTGKYCLDVPLGSLISYQSSDFINLDFYNGDKKIGYLKVYCKCFINDNLTSFWFDNEDKKYHGHISYFGKGNIILEVSDANDNIVFTKTISNDDSIVIESMESFVDYNLKIVDKKLGFSFEPNREIYSKTIKYYDMNNFVGKTFKLFTADFDQTIKGIWQRKTLKLHNTFVEIINQIEDTKFIGNVYYYNGTKRYFNALNPVEIEFISDINNGQVEALITQEGDGLFIDFTNHTILNQLFSNTATDIHSYIVNLERKRKE